MRAYSQDLRERVLNALERHEGTISIARRLEVSRDWVYEVRLRYESTGERTARRQSGHGRRPARNRHWCVHSCNAHENHQMADIVLVSCVKSKRNAPCAAKDMYVSPLFKKMMAYAINSKPKNIFILSAKYHLLTLDKEIEPYEKTLNKMKISERRMWAENVLECLRHHADLDLDRFVFLAGRQYWKGLIDSMKNYSVPMEGLAFGKQLQWLERQSHV